MQVLSFGPLQEFFYFSSVLVIKAIQQDRTLNAVNKLYFPTFFSPHVHWYFKASEAGQKEVTKEPLFFPPSWFSPSAFLKLVQREVTVLFLSTFYITSFGLCFVDLGCVCCADGLVWFFLVVFDCMLFSLCRKADLFLAYVANNLKLVHSLMRRICSKTI